MIEGLRVSDTHSEYIYGGFFMSKKIVILFTAFILAACLGACSAGAPAGGSQDDKVQIVATIFPEYDWVMNILGDKSGDAEVTMLLDKGVDLHSYQPTADDILKISTCDMFIYVGGESDEWVADALKEAVNKDMVTVNLLEVLGTSVKEEEVVEGMQEEEHEHEHEEEEAGEEEHEHEEHEEEAEYDEHVWLSLKNAATLTEYISNELQKIDPDNAKSYKKNTEDYVAKLGELDKKYSDTVEKATIKTVLFGDRFPFRYLTDDYGLTYYAAFVGCSAETEASFETVMFLANKVDELKLPAVMTIEGDDHRIAETIVENTQSRDQKILTMDSMQSTTSDDVKGGTTYMSVMENNLTALAEALK